MNVIANDCVGAYLYQNHYKCDFMNPFIWSSIDIENFCELIKNYDSLNFNNIKCELIINDSDICKKKSLIPKIIIDNKVEVNYFHYIYNEKYHIPTKLDGYTQCDDIKQYTIDCYKRRISKMSEKPIFLWDVTRQQWYNKSFMNPVDALKNLNSVYTIIVHMVGIENKQDANLILLKKDNIRNEVNQSAANIYKMYLNRL